MAAPLLRGFLSLGEPSEDSSSGTAGHGSVGSALSHENLENRTLLMVPKLYLWFSDSVVWTQCAHGGSHTWNFDLLVSTPRGQCWLLQLPASYVTLRATGCTVLLNDDVHRCSDRTVTFLFLCVMNTCVCNCLCVLVCVCVCMEVRVTSSYVPLRVSILISADSRVSHWPWGLLFQWVSCLSLPSSEVTANRGKLLCGWGGLRASWLHS